MVVTNNIKDEDKTNKENKSIAVAPGSTTSAGGPGNSNLNPMNLLHDGIERKEFDKMLKSIYVK